MFVVFLIRWRKTGELVGWLLKTCWIGLLARVYSLSCLFNNKRSENILPIHKPNLAHFTTVKYAWINWDNV